MVGIEKDTTTKQREHKMSVLQATGGWLCVLNHFKSAVIHKQTLKQHN